MAEETHHRKDEQLSADEERKRASSAASLFDVRRVIGGLFVVYGLIVTLIGLFDSSSDIDKAQGVRINLWMGLAMLALGLLMLLWLRLNPTNAPDLSPTPADHGAPEASAEK